MAGKSRPRKTYSDQDKAVALATLQAMGGNVKRTSEHLGIPERTLGDWRDGKGVSEFVLELQENGMDAVATMVEGLLQAIIPSMVEDIEFMNHKDKAITVGILIDKLLLLRGQPTSIQEGRGVPTSGVFAFIQNQYGSK